MVSGCGDLSVVYGDTNDVAESLRTFKNGKLIVTERQGQTWPPQVENVTQGCPKAPTQCYRGGNLTYLNYMNTYR